MLDKERGIKRGVNSTKCGDESETPSTPIKVRYIEWRWTQRLSTTFNGKHCSLISFIFT